MGSCEGSRCPGRGSCMRSSVILAMIAFLTAISFASPSWGVSRQADDESAQPPATRQILDTVAASNLRGATSTIQCAAPFYIADFDAGDEGWTVTPPNHWDYLDNYGAQMRGVWWCGEEQCALEGGRGYGDNWNDGLTVEIPQSCTISQTTGAQGSLAGPGFDVGLGQSFVACATGEITAIAVDVGFGGGSAELHVLEGLGGLQASPQSVTLVSGTNTITLDTPFPVAVGTAYSFVLIPSALTQLMGGAGDPYLDGTFFAVDGAGVPDLSQIAMDLRFVAQIDPSPGAPPVAARRGAGSTICEYSQPLNGDTMETTTPTGIGQVISACASGRLTAIDIDVDLVDDPNVTVKIGVFVPLSDVVFTYTQSLSLGAGTQEIALDQDFPVTAGTAYLFALFPSSGTLRLRSDVSAEGLTYFVADDGTLAGQPSGGTPTHAFRIGGELTLEIVHQYDTEADFDECSVSVFGDVDPTMPLVTQPFSGDSSVLLGADGEGFVTDVVTIPSSSDVSARIDLTFASDGAVSDASGYPQAQVPPLDTEGAWRIDRLTLKSPGGQPLRVWDLESDDGGWQRQPWVSTLTQSQGPATPAFRRECPPGVGTAPPDEMCAWVAYDLSTELFESPTGQFPSTFIEVGIQSPVIALPPGDFDAHVLEVDVVLPQDAYCVAFGWKVRASGPGICQDFDGDGFLRAGQTSDWSHLAFDLSGLRTDGEPMIPQGAESIELQLVASTFFNASNPGFPFCTAPTFAPYFGDVSLFAFDDDVDPVAVCQNLTIPLGEPGSPTEGQAFISAGMIDGGSTDDCGIASRTVMPTSFDCTNLGENMVTLTVTDYAANSSAVQCTVTVEPPTEPLVFCPTGPTPQVEAGTYIVPGDVGVSSCGDEVFVFPWKSDCDELGPQTVTAATYSEAGGVVGCEVMVDVVANASPPSLDPIYSQTVSLDADGTHTMAIEDFNFDSVTLDCDLPITPAFVGPPITVTCADNGTIVTVPVSLTDAQNNSAEYDVSVVVLAGDETVACDCGNGVLDPDEECDGGPDCLPSCESGQSVQCVGQGTQNAIHEIVTDPDAAARGGGSAVTVYVQTTAGQSAEDIARTVAGALNANQTLRGLGVYAFSEGAFFRTNGGIVSVTSGDPGITFQDQVAVADNVVAVEADPSACLSTTNTCVSGTPVTITRTDATPIRGVSVTFELVDLDLCGGLAGILEGDYLADSDPGAQTTMQALDNGDGTYTVDLALLGTPCGAAAAAGTLFTADLTHAGVEGSGTMSIVGVDVRDCGNGVLDATAGGGATIPVDLTAPDAVSDLDVAPLTTGNPAGATLGVDVTWSSTEAGSVLDVYAKGYGNYPEYDDPPGAGGVPSLPADPAAAVSEGWTPVATTDTPFTDRRSSRDEWYYVGFAVDACGNVSAPSNSTGGDLNYLLGDFAPVGSADNTLDVLDLSLIGGVYGTSDGDALYEPTVDIGPTDDMSVLGRPLTDDVVDFEDLILLGINYGAVATTPPRTQPVRVPSLVLETSGGAVVGGTHEVGLALAGGSGLQGVSIALGWNPEIVRPVGLVAAEAARLQSGEILVLSPTPGVVDAVAIGEAILGDGGLARVTFEVLAPGDPDIGVTTVIARDGTNAPLDLGVVEAAPAPVPVVTRLFPSAPNPFRSVTGVAFDIASAGSASVRVFGVDGRLIRTLADGVLPPGAYHMSWDGRDDAGRSVSSGIYLLKFVADGVEGTQRIVRLR